MKIITASNETFKDILALTLPINLRHGSVTVHNCQTVHHQRAERFGGTCPGKPEYLLNSYENGPMLWLDADAWIVRPIPETIFDDCDIAVTMRRPSERGRSCSPDLYGYLNSGVVFVNDTAEAYGFLVQWLDEVPKTQSRSDQHALNNLVREYTDLTEYGKVFARDGIRVKILTTDEFNWYYFGETPGPETKILHMKTDMRRQHSVSDWVKKEWL